MEYSSEDRHVQRVIQEFAVRGNVQIKEEEMFVPELFIRAQTVIRLLVDLGHAASMELALKIRLL